jgi:hypothetical protein
MDNQTKLVERIALELLRRDGAAVIWQAQVTAATASREGHAKAAEVLLKIADAAEEILRRDVEREIYHCIDCAKSLAWSQASVDREVEKRPDPAES